MKPPYGSLPSPLDEAVKARFAPRATIAYKVPLDEPTMDWWHGKLGGSTFTRPSSPRP